MADASLILDEFTFDPKVKSDDQVLLRVGGRASGIRGIILGVLNLGTRSTIIVTRREITFQFTNLSGITYIVCPLDTLTCSLSGVFKPFWALALGGLLIIGAGLNLITNGEMLLTLIGGVIGLGLAVFYYFTKNLILTFSTGNIGSTRGLGFEATILNGRQIDQNLLLEVVKHLNYHIVDVKYNGVVIDPNYKPVMTAPISSPVSPTSIADEVDVDALIGSLVEEDNEPDTEAEGQKLYDEALDKFKQGKYEDSIAMLQRVKTLAPSLTQKVNQGIRSAKKKLQDEQNPN